MTSSPSKKVIILIVYWLYCERFEPGIILNLLTYCVFTIEWTLRRILPYIFPAGGPLLRKGRNRDTLLKFLIRGRPFNSWGWGWVISGHQELFFLAIWWAGYFFPFFSHKLSITFVLHAIFFFRQALAGNFFSKSPTPSPPSRVKWSAPKSNGLTVCAEPCGKIWWIVLLQGHPTLIFGKHLFGRRFEI